jgi:hypothetical protein
MPRARRLPVPLALLLPALAVLCDVTHLDGTGPAPHGRALVRGTTRAVPWFPARSCGLRPPGIRGVLRGGVSGAENGMSEVAPDELAMVEQALADDRMDVDSGGARDAVAGFQVGRQLWLAASAGDTEGIDAAVAASKAIGINISAAVHSTVNGGSALHWASIHHSPS